MKKIALLFLLFAPSALAQAPSGTPLSRFDGNVPPAGFPNGPASVAVCSSGGSGGPPCSPLALIYTDANGTAQQGNPFTTQANGHYTFFAPAGSYAVQTFGTGYSTVLTTVTLAAVGGGSLPGGANTQVQFNNNGIFGGVAGFIFDGTKRATIGNGTTGSSLCINVNSAAVGSCNPDSANDALVIEQVGGSGAAISWINTGNSGGDRLGPNGSDQLVWTNSAGTGGYLGKNYNTTTNCSSSASPAVCATAAAGSVVVAAGATTVQVNTTQVTANSQVQLTRDNSLGTKLSVTCNTQSSLVLGAPYVSARTGGTSFTITIDAAPTTNPMCISYSIVN